MQESGLQFDEVGGLLEGQSSKFWIRRAEFKEIAYGIAESTIGELRSDISVTKKYSQSEPKYSTNPEIGRHENGRRTLYIHLNFRRLESQRLSDAECYAAAVTTVFVRGGFFSQRLDYGYRADEEAEFLSANSRNFTITFLVCDDNVNLDQVVATAMKEAVSPIAKNLKKGDRKAP